MNPVIVHPQGNPSRAYLIDKHAVVTGTMPNGKQGRICLCAIDIRHLRAGEMAAIDGHIYPRPCQLAAWEGFTEHGPLWRGIYPDACRALLTLSHGMKTEVTPGRDFVAGRDAAGWNQWHFLTAWGWSLWQQLQREGGEWPLERRWQELTAKGYPATFGAFRQVCSRLNLLVTESRPNL
jgi:hypothetical protein